MEKGLSLDELASQAGVSRAMLSRIERGESSPTIGLLCKVSMALGVSITRLVAEPAKNRCRLIKKGEVVPFSDPTGIVRTSLSTDLGDWGIELIRYDFPARSTTGEGCGCKDAREIIHVAAGELEVRGSVGSYRVTEGESLILESLEAPFEMRNPLSQKTTAYLVFDRRPNRNA